MNHPAINARQAGISPVEYLWIVWAELAEDMLGHTLDGDQDRDGYSIDGAVLAFEEGCSVVEYVLAVKARTADITKGTS